MLPAKDEIAKPLAVQGSYPAREKTMLDHGHTVTFAEPFWAGTGLQTFLVMRPLTDIISTLELPDGVHIEFLHAIPLYPFRGGSTRKRRVPRL